ncbi:MAG: helix-turn-helix domain-containing protein, partial [Nostocaceae cyanobacterium]|nr:helix-turn-helix domain-containing protein [Nostocaceae cyanobacterium]
MVGTTEAAYLLGISCQRVRQLLNAGRIRGAVKEGRFWRIPLFNGMPRVKVIKRGTKGTWRRLRQASGTIVHVSKPQLDSDRKHKTNSPVIIVRQGSRTTHCRSAIIAGPSRILY